MIDRKKCDVQILPQLAIFPNYKLCKTILSLNTFKFRSVKQFLGKSFTILSFEF